jgi:hypothetical protein
MRHETARTNAKNSYIFRKKIRWEDTLIQTENCSKKQSD